MPDTFPTPWLNKYNEFHIPHDVPVFDRPLYAALDDAARDYPDRPAILYGDSRISYKRLHLLAERFSASLHRLGLKKGDRVALMLPNLPQTVVAYWGILKCGGVVVMTNPLYMETELIGHLNDAGCRFMILLDTYWTKVTALRDRLPVEKFIVTAATDAVDGTGIQPVEPKNPRVKPHVISYGPHVLPFLALLVGDEQYTCPIEDPIHTVAMLQYTGGTTGTPKGVMLTHSNLGTDAAIMVSHLHMKKEVRHIFLSIMPFFHVYGLSLCCIDPVFLAAATIPVPHYSPADSLNLISRFHPTVFPSAPSVFTSLLQQKTLEKYDLTSIQICMSGSAPLPYDVLERFQKITGSRIMEGYGLSEASPVTHFNAIELTKDSSIGMPLPDTDACIVDTETGTKLMPPGKLGELIIRGPQVMIGYWNKPEETKNTLRDGWLYTGDIAYMDEDGFFFIMDRKKDMALVGGYNVYPREVDEVLMSHPGIEEAVTIGVPDPIRGETIKAFIVPGAGVKLRASEIVAWCRARLASYKVPRSIEFRDSLPRTQVGKILRRTLREEEIRKHQNKA